MYTKLPPRYLRKHNWLHNSKIQKDWSSFYMTQEIYCIKRRTHKRVLFSKVKVKMFQKVIIISRKAKKGFLGPKEPQLKRIACRGECGDDGIQCQTFKWYWKLTGDILKKTNPCVHEKTSKSIGQKIYKEKFEGKEDQLNQRSTGKCFGEEYVCLGKIGNKISSYREIVKILHDLIWFQTEDVLRTINIHEGLPNDIRNI